LETSLQRADPDMVNASARLRKANVEPAAQSPKDPTRSFYEGRAAEYAEATRSRAVDARLSDFSKRIPGGVILDLGCGAGYDLDSFRSHGHFALGLDYAEPLVRIARRTSRCSVVVADARAIPIRSGVFNGVWASASLLHLARSDLQFALCEIRRVLKPGGLLFCSMKVGAGMRRSEDGRSFTLYQHEDWQSALISQGFGSIEISFNEGEAKRPSGRSEKWMTSLALSP
jgi:SAM-dependent methyltransferase